MQKNYLDREAFIKMLQAGMACEVIVIGGGATGLGTASTLRRGGIQLFYLSSC
ncbi:MAG: hypothetical protein JWN76_3257 [Chitinophagaceae bacterium]|nr:hypothetical protein [Chitinophagaceae bacterium]